MFPKPVLGVPRVADLVQLGGRDLGLRLVLASYRILLVMVAHFTATVRQTSYSRRVLARFCGRDPGDRRRSDGRQVGAHLHDLLGVRGNG